MITSRSRLLATALFGSAVIVACGSPDRGFDEPSPSEDGGNGGSPAVGGQSSGGGSQSSGGGSQATGGGGGSGGSGGGPLPECGIPGTECCAGNVCVTGATCAGDECSCDQGLDACPDACVDLQADPDNCGSCGHDCLGGVCDTGACQPFTVAQNQTNLQAVETDGSYVYWSGRTANTDIFYVARRRVDNSDAVKVLATGEVGMSNLGLSSTNVYWVAGGKVRSCDLPDCVGGPVNALPGTLATGCGYGVTFSQATQKLFWSCFSTYGVKDGTLWWLTLPQTTPAALGPNPANPTGLALDSANLYWLNSSTYNAQQAQNTDGGVFKARLSDGVTTQLVGGLQGDLGGAIAVGGGSLYFAGGIGTGNVGGDILKVPLPNGVGNVLPPKFVDASFVRGMVADAQFVYFTDDGNFVARCPHSGCVPATVAEVIAPGEGSPTEMAQDSVSIYWLNFNGGTVRRLAK